MSVLFKDQDNNINMVAGASYIPVGSIMPFMGKNAPNGWLLCDGSEFNTEEYKELFSVLESSILPDLRETVLVGVGENTTLTIADHDVYEVGEFKDDQFQKHSTYPITSAWNAGNVTGVSWSGTGGTPGKQFPDDDGLGGNKPRMGSTTHGKQFGVNYIIRAV